MQMLGGPNPDGSLRLWLLMMGCMITIDEQDTWMREQLQLAIAGVGITSWSGMRTKLDEVMWIPLVHDVHGSNIFHQS